MAKGWRPECLAGRATTCSFFRPPQTPGLAQPPTKWIDWGGVRGRLNWPEHAALSHSHIHCHGEVLTQIRLVGTGFVSLQDRPPSVIFSTEPFLHRNALPKVPVRTSKFKKLTVFRLCSQNASSLDFSSSSTCMFWNTQHSSLLICHKTVNCAYRIIAIILKFIQLYLILLQALHFKGKSLFLCCLEKFQGSYFRKRRNVRTHD